MKKFALVLVLISIVGVLQTEACEICGCGVGNFYMGMVPKYGRAFVGVRYRYTNYESQMHHDPSEISNDYYKTMELWGGWNISPRWQVMAFVPYQVNKRVMHDGEKNESGLADIFLLSNYRAWSHVSNSVNQQFWLGGGVKVPTGQYKVDFNDPENNLGDPNGQTGTGSVDFLVNATHVMSINKWGVNTTLSYKINSVNSDEFKFGNRAFINTLAYYRFGGQSFSVSPVVGAMYERSGSNHFEGVMVEHTGGQALLASTGLEVSARLMSVGFTLQSPVAQDFSDGQTTMKPRGLAHMTFTF